MPGQQRVEARQEHVTRNPSQRIVTLCVCTFAACLKLCCCAQASIDAGARYTYTAFTRLLPFKDSTPCMSTRTMATRPASAQMTRLGAGMPHRLQQLWHSKLLLFTKVCMCSICSTMSNRQAMQAYVKACGTLYQHRRLLAGCFLGKATFPCVPQIQFMSPDHQNTEARLHQRQC